MKRQAVLAIDGGAGTGKTTTACEVARRLGFAYIDSGALYRAIGLAARTAGLAGSDDSAIAALLDHLPVRVEMRGESLRVFLGESEVKEELRDPDVTTLASKLAVRPDVRARVVAWLNELVRMRPAVVEGRDIGTSVFPDAELKIFLTASLPVRARRRQIDLSRQGIVICEEEVARQLAERDQRDSERALAPLVRAPDAVLLDTTGTDIEGQVEQILGEWGRRVGPRRRRRYAADQWIIRTGARVLWGMRVEGLERVPPVGGVILAANHKSYLDPPLIGSVLPREIFYLAKRELFRIPVFSAWMRARNAIPIDREGSDRGAIEGALHVLRGGGALLVFPEGTRIRRPGLGPPHEGVALLAARAGVPILPVHLRGSWSAERRWLRPGGLRIRFGEPFRLPPVPPGRAGRAAFPGIAARIMEAIERLSSL